MSSKASSFRKMLWLGGFALGVAAIPSASLASPTGEVPASTEHALNLSQSAGGDLRPFYEWRQNKPLWLDSDQRLSPAAEAFAELLRTAEYDGIDPEVAQVSQLEEALRRAKQERSASSLMLAEIALSRSFAAYVSELRKPRSAGMLYEHQILRPRDPRPSEALLEASRAPSLVGYVSAMGWMHPLYGSLRRALTSGPALGPAERDVVIGNLERLRALPAFPGRYVLVDAASAQLWMYENGRQVDSMRVVVGKPTHQTPMIAGYIRQAIFNPYWNVPDDLIQANIAPNVLRQGVGYLKNGGYEVLSDWSSHPAPVDPRTIDWRRVANGGMELRVRQLPGQANFMGRVKFEFPNNLGIYLHDTPDKDLMARDARQFSSGCIRLEDAQRLGRWLLKGSAPSLGGAPEQRVDLPEPVPVFVTYLTARVVDGRLALSQDPYHRDQATALAVTLPRQERLAASR
jgi:murein L,D-transpeptidase YcbB/YkuD